jgi:hypothetical protein
MTVLKAGEITKSNGRHPSQIVLRQTKPGTFATHIKVLPPDTEPRFILGRYFFKREEAEADFENRITELKGPQSRSKP